MIAKPIIWNEKENDSDYVFGNQPSRSIKYHPGDEKCWQAHQGNGTFLGETIGFYKTLKEAKEAYQIYDDAEIYVQLSDTMAGFMEMELPSSYVTKMRDMIKKMNIKGRRSTYE